MTKIHPHNMRPPHDQNSPLLYETTPWPKSTPIVWSKSTLFVWNRPLTKAALVVRDHPWPKSTLIAWDHPLTKSTLIVWNHPLNKMYSLYVRPTPDQCHPCRIKPPPDQRSPLLHGMRPSVIKIHLCIMKPPHFEAACFSKLHLLIHPFNPFPAKPFTLLMLFSSKSSLKELLKSPEMFIFRNQLHFRMYQKMEFTQEVSIQHPVASSIQTAHCVPCHRSHIAS